MFHVAGQFVVVDPETHLASVMEAVEFIKAAAIKRAVGHLGADGDFFCHVLFAVELHAEVPFPDDAGVVFFCL